MDNSEKFFKARDKLINKQFRKAKGSFGLDHTSTRLLVVAMNLDTLS